MRTLFLLHKTFGPNQMQIKIKTFFLGLQADILSWSQNTLISKEPSLSPHWPCEVMETKVEFLHSSSFQKATVESSCTYCFVTYLPTSQYIINTLLCYKLYAHRVLEHNLIHPLNKDIMKYCNALLCWALRLLYQLSTVQTGSADIVC